MAERYASEMTVFDWGDRFVASGCGSRQVDFVVTGTERRHEKHIGALFIYPNRRAQMSS